MSGDAALVKQSKASPARKYFIMPLLNSALIISHFEQKVKHFPLPPCKIATWREQKRLGQGRTKVS